MSTYHFTVDAALLRELGERLVGRPHMALAELIKNSYDADATAVIIEFAGESITVVDDGHGMSESDFANRWMRIGTTRKQRDGASPRFRRPLTGSKGVGRLAVQLLGRITTVQSRALANPTERESELLPPIEASINWDSALRQGELTSVRVEVDEPSAEYVQFADNSLHGTRIEIRSLTDAWNTAQFQSLAREIWALRPPFEDDSGAGMSITLNAPSEEIEAQFARQMDSIFQIWSAKVVGHLLPTDSTVTDIDGVLPPALLTSAGELEDSFPLLSGEAGLPDRFLRISVELRNGPKRVTTYRVPASTLHELRYEIRVFSLQRRQSLGIAVGMARDYLRQYGGVGIYDSGFRLPYYGVEQDWLDSERDHARRLAQSRLIPDSLQVKRGLQDLPPNSWLYGVVRVSTAREADAARTMAVRRDPLSIQVTRDRLTSNAAYHQLRVLVRTGLDLYAMETARQKLKDATRSKRGATRPASQVLGALASVVAHNKNEIPAPTFSEISDAVAEATQSAKAAEESQRAYSSLLGALATAGTTSLAYEHEISKQVIALKNLADDLLGISAGLSEPERATVLSAVGRMREWDERIAGIRAVFGPLLNKEDREAVRSYRARTTIEQVFAELSVLVSGIIVDLSGVPFDVMLPPATLPAWTSIFQNLIFNANNAMAHTKAPTIRVDAGSRSGSGFLRFSDNGAGVDLEESEDLWEPFERRLFLSRAQEAAGLGGIGLGLTIVRMIVDDIDVSARFIPPVHDFATTVELQWKARTNE